MVFRHRSFFFAMFIVISTSTTSVSAQDRRFQDCRRQFECGTFIVGYPFWGGDRPSYCGLPEFHLNCYADQTPTINILSQNYQVLRVDGPSRFLTVVRTDYQRDLCLNYPSNTTIDRSSFGFAPDAQFVTLYYNCSSRPDEVPSSLGQFYCASSNPGYFLTNEDRVSGYDATIRSLLENCSTKVMIPTNRTAVAANLEGTWRQTAESLQRVIAGGFGLRWTANDSACDDCRSSGGVCGFDEASSSWACFCADRDYAFQCEGQNRNGRLPLKILLPVVMFIALFAVALTCIRSRALKKQREGQKEPRIRIVDSSFTKFKKLAGFKGSSYNNDDVSASKFGGSREPPTLRAFSFSDVKAATNNFSGENLLGSGGFGPVYKAVLPGGELMAVKRLSKSSTQGLVEFTNEVSLTARLQHVNLVRVVGFCTENEEKMLVYEFMPGGSLDTYLFDPVKKLSLNWSVRVRIIEGVTQGLLYLQEYSNFTIIHRDLKAGNILLDDGMNPKISDFGMAKLFRKDLFEANTNRIVGTYGYVPPEYVKNGIYSMKYDVYSFGVLLLQIISGKRSQRYYGPNEDMHLLDHAYDSWRRGEGMGFCDPSLDDSSSQCKLTTCLQTALLCVQEDPEDRPTMLKVSSVLKTGALGMASPKKPAFSVKKEPAVHVTNFKCQPEIWSYNEADISQVQPR